MDDRLIIRDSFGAVVARNGELGDKLPIHGMFDAVCRDASGRIKWRDRFSNTVVTVGINALFDNSLAGSSYTVTGPYMGLISSVSFSAISASDTMSSHSGWLEAGNAHAPTYSGNRKTCVWSAASGGSKALSAGLVFTFTGSGTVKGGFIVYGTGALNTIDNTAGTLFSAGLFSGGDKVVGNTDTLTINYAVSA